jgi:carbamoyl-phosphate synthase large subunit
MARILLGGAGGAPTNNVVMSLRAAGGDHLIGMCSEATDLLLAQVDEKHLVPPASAPDYLARLETVIRASRPEMMHVQHDFEVRAISRARDRIHALGVKTLLPSAEAIETCVDKAKSYRAWKAAGLRVPETVLLETEDDLRRAFGQFGRVWLRATEGAAGAGALPTDDLQFAKLWIDLQKGWGRFTAAELLTPRSVTWLSIWFEGQLVVAQTRRRHSWSFSSRALSGVTGVTAVGETYSDPVVTEVAQSAIAAVDRRPQGIFAVDMTYDDAGRPNPTEINIGRFFTTVHFFTMAGVNFPKIYRDLALRGEVPDLRKRINPLPDGLLWIRGMDVPPLLTTAEALAALRAKE